MTEINVMSGCFFREPKPIIHTINPVRFAIAFIGAPFALALGSFWVFLIPVVALYYGLPFWIGFTLPFLLWYLPRFGPSPYLIIWTTLLGALAGCVQLLYFANQGGWQVDFDLIMIWLLLCTVHGCLWGLIFRNIYE